MSCKFIIANSTTLNTLNNSGLCTITHDTLRSSTSLPEYFGRLWLAVMEFRGALAILLVPIVTLFY